MCEQPRLWSDCGDAQADLSLCWWHRLGDAQADLCLCWWHKSYCRFCCALAHFSYFSKKACSGYPSEVPRRSAPNKHSQHVFMEM